MLKLIVSCFVSRFNRYRVALVGVFMAALIGYSGDALSQGAGLSAESAPHVQAADAAPVVITPVVTQGAQVAADAGAAPVVTQPAQVAADAGTAPNVAPDAAGRPRVVPVVEKARPATPKSGQAVDAAPSRVPDASTPSRVPEGTSGPPAEVRPVEVPPAQVPPAEVPSVEVSPAQVPPVEVRAAQVPSVEVRPAQVPPVDVSEPGSSDEPGLSMDGGAVDGGAVDGGAVDGGAVDAGADTGMDGGVVDAGGAAVHEPSDTDHAGIIIKAILGLSLLFLLAYLAAHPMFKQAQERLGIAHLITAGFPFVALGWIARHPFIGILSDDVLEQLTPVLNFGLGWLGFVIGAQLDIRFLDKLPKGTAFLVLAEASAPFAVIALVCGAVMVAFGLDYQSSTLLRDAVLLGAAGAMTATLHRSGLTEARPWTGHSELNSSGIEALVSQLDEIWGVACLLFMVAFLRPPGSAGTWLLPGTGWVFVTLGLGVAVGLLMFVMVRAPRSPAEFLAVLLGIVAFGAGLAGYLRLSPIVVCFLAGVLIANFPFEQRERLSSILNHLERSIHLVFLIIVGALWDVGDWRGWALVPCFVASRFFGRWLGMVSGNRSIAVQGQTPPAYGPVVTPLSVLSLALVVSVQSLYGRDTIPWLLTAVIGGAVVTEIIVQLAPSWSREPAARPELAADARPTKGDGDAELSGPIHRSLDRPLDDRRKGRDGEDW